MATDHHKTTEEFEELKKEIDNFREEKERVRAIVGKIGGIPSANTKLWNAIFIFVVVASFFVSLFSHGTLRLAMVEVGIIALSLKLIILIHYQMKVNHFQLWILSSLEWRINELSKKIKDN